MAFLKEKKNGKTTSFDFFQNHLYFSGSRLLIMIATFLCAFFLHLSIYAGFVSFLFYAYDFFSGLCSSSFVSAYRLILLAVIRSSFVVIYCPYGMFHIFLLPFCKLVLVFSTILFLVSLHFFMGEMKNDMNALKATSFSFVFTLLFTIN